MTAPAIRGTAPALFGGLVAALAWLALLLQAALNTGSLANLLSYFTILSNLLVALSLSAASGWPTTSLGRACARPTTQTAVALYILVVGVVYNAVLRGLLEPRGWARLADELLHVVVPAAYGLYWYWVVPRGSLVWRNLWRWLGFPAGYLAYSLLRGPLAHWYPYPFLNAPVLGYGRVGVNSGLVLLCFLGVGAALIALNRLGRTGPHPLPSSPVN